MATFIAHAKQNENGGVVGGTPGDQTGQECMTEPWYLRGQNGVIWDTVYRPKNGVYGEHIAAFAEQACNNQHIGYNQNARYTLYDIVKNNGYNAAAVTTDCDCDCSSLVACCCLAAGLSVSPSMTTRDEDEILMRTNEFLKYQSEDYTHSGDKLQRGDILHRSGHTAVVIQNSNSTAMPESEPKGFSVWMYWSVFESGFQYDNPQGWSVMGGMGNGAYGRYQFQYQFGLVPFMQYCLSHDISKYTGFKPYIDLGAGSEQLKNNAGLHNLFIQYTNNYLDDFAACQNTCMLEQYYRPCLATIERKFGFNPESKGPYLRGAICSMSIRFGAETAADFYSGVKDMSERDAIIFAYAQANNYSQIKFGGDDGRWTTGGPYSEYDTILAQLSENSFVYNLIPGYLPTPGNPSSPNKPVEHPTPQPEPDASPGPSTGNGRLGLYILQYFCPDIVPMTGSIKF